MWRIFQFDCGFPLLAGLVPDDAALKGRKSPPGGGQETGGKRRTRCRFIGASWLCLLSALTAGAAHAAERVFDIDIPAMNAAEALNRLADQTGSVMLFSYDLARARQANAVRGRYTLLEGLSLLLRDTGLSGGLSDKRIVVIAETGNEPAGEGTIVRKELMNKRGFFAALVAAIAGSGAAQAEQAAQEAPHVALEEVVVTAQKRVERLLDVPVPVTAVDAEDLISSHQLRMQDYYTRIPGLSLTTDSFGQPTLSIRGITTGLGNPTVGITVDDVPYGSVSPIGYFAPDIDPYDLARVEVLRGPQGTLYGASSIGGLLKFVTEDPETDAFRGRAQVGISSVHNGDDPGFNLRASVNVPMGENFALRASGFTRRDAGYIDDPGRGLEGVNQVDVSGGRLTGLWQASPTVSLKVGAFIQRIEADGSPTVHDLPGLGELEQNMLIGTGTYEKEIQVYTANLRAEFGKAALTYVGGYSINDLADVFDYTPAFGPLSELVFGQPGTPLSETLNTKRLTQEIRLTTPLTSRLDGLFGYFYSDEKTRTAQDIYATDPATGEQAGQWLHDDDARNFTENALFADLTVHFTDRFDLQIGGRQSWMKYDYTLAFEGPYVPFFLGSPSPLIYPKVTTEEESFTYLVTPQLRLGDGQMIYARVASGYRPGGPNYNVATFGVPPAYDADETRNYDVGAKGTLFANTLSYDASLFYIDWKDIQLLIVDGTSGAAYFTNASKARSQGAEFSLEWRARQRLMIGAWAVFADAELTESFPAGSTAYGVPGDRLPFSSRFSGGLTLNSGWSLSNGVAVDFGTTLSYVGDRKADFTATPERQTLPSYTQLDANVEFRLGAWSANLFATNLTDERGLLGGGIGSFPTYAFNYIQPRTFGIDLSRSF